MDDKRLSYFLFGLGMGVGIGILFAPKSGEETREILKGKAGEGREFLRRKTEEIRDSTTEILNKGREAFQSQKENLAAALEAGKQAYRQSVSADQPRSSEGPAGM
ncbi:MAG TPA: YtxH domain-containing protein [Bryobacterales bacterium]|jgi:gas vesicle protein|nr:YtxH domain-containing protein [Bryobacterales bacterium]